MKLLHTLKGGKKTNEIDLTRIRYATRHQKNKDGVRHEGWTVTGMHEDKEHEYTLVFSPEEAREFREKLDKMLSRFDSVSLDFIQEESHDG